MQIDPACLFLNVIEWIGKEKERIFFSSFNISTIITNVRPLCVHERQPTSNESMCNISNNESNQFVHNHK